MRDIYNEIKDLTYWSNIIKTVEEAGEYLKNTILKNKPFLTKLEEEEGFEYDGTIGPLQLWVTKHGAAFGYSAFTSYCRRNKWGWSEVCDSAKLVALEDQRFQDMGTYAHWGFEYYLLQYIWNKLEAHVFYEAQCNMIQDGKRRRFHPDISTLVEGKLKDVFESNIEAVLGPELRVRGFRGEAMKQELARLKTEIKQLNFDFYSGWSDQDLFAKTQKGYQGEHKLNLVVLTSNKKPPRFKLDEIPKGEHVFFITKSQMFRLLGMIPNGVYAKRFTKYQSLYEYSYSKDSKFKRLRQWAKDLEAKMEAINENEEFGYHINSDGYREFCDGHPNEDIKDLYNDYTLPPQDQNLGRDDDEEGGDGLPANYVGDSD
ncbi:MAG: hypothetical protein GF353_25510 [Candidatus Lokiarchaeota archaeon]|nr:hypothetical protein [Candidatus Lokiarchaeota archaeon]